MNRKVIDTVLSRCLSSRDLTDPSSRGLYPRALTAGSIKKSNINIFFKLLVFSIFVSPLAYSLPSDNLQKIDITAERFDIDYTHGFAVYHGQVKFTQGTRKLSSDSLYIYFDQTKDNKDNKATKNSGNLAIKEIKAIGHDKLVSYSEQVKLPKESSDSTNSMNTMNTMSAKAKIMKFTPQLSLITLQENAVIKQDGKILTSNLLHYNIKTEIAYSPKQKDQRNKLIIG